jgi:hypothetical protein
LLAGFEDPLHHCDEEHRADLAVIIVVGRSEISGEPTGPTPLAVAAVIEADARLAVPLQRLEPVAQRMKPELTSAFLDGLEDSGDGDVRNKLLQPLLQPAYVVIGDRVRRRLASRGAASERRRLHQHRLLQHFIEREGAIEIRLAAYGDEGVAQIRERRAFLIETEIA